MTTPMLIPIIVTICAIIIASLLFLSKQKTRSIGSRGNTILLAGELSSGKTAMFYYLKTGQFVDTVTSIQPNSATFPLTGFSKPLPSSRAVAQVYDLPGHGTFKSLLTKVLPETKTIFFLVDSNATGFSQAAQSLYTYLTNKHIAMAQIPIVIVCNKIDQPGAMPIEMVKNKLTQEIEVIRKANAGIKQLESIGNEDNILGSIPLTNDDKSFTFDEAATSVDWVAISLKAKKNLDALIDFI